MSLRTDRGSKNRRRRQAAIQRNLLLILAISGWWLGSEPARSQVVPDATLAQPSIAINQGDRISIQGGTSSGTNLFHSFEQFSIPATLVVSFDEIPAATANVLARVTGDQASIINGQLGSNHPASLFLINPNGIEFGDGAQLALGGSFIATTAQQVEFADGRVWSIEDASPTNLLALDIPIGLQAGSTPGVIVNRSQASSALFDRSDPEAIATLPPDILANPFRAPNVGLEVVPGRSLALVGGDTIVESGNLTAPSGQIYLASLADRARVNWQPTTESFAFTFDLAQNFGAVDVRGTSVLDVSGVGGGDIRLLGDRLNLQDQATLTALTFGARTSRGVQFVARDRIDISDAAAVLTVTFATGGSGNITAQAGGTVTLSGLGLDNLAQLQAAQLTTTAESLTDRLLSGALPLLGLNAGSLSAGNAGNVNISARNLQADNGALVLTAAGGNGSGGNIDLAIAETISISRSLFQASSLRGSIGNAGNVNLQANDLELGQNGTFLSATLGSGAGGDINLRVSNAFSFTGEPLPGGIFSQGLPAGLFVNSLIASGGAGNINVHADTVNLNGIGYISSQSGADLLGFGRFDQAGTGGNITIQADDSMTIANGLANAVSAGSITSNVAGSVQIQTPWLRVQNGSEISVSSLGLGDAGTLAIQADRLELSDGARLSAITQVGRSGGIAIHAEDLRLDNRSSISTNAGSSNGGNIAIVTDTLVARNNSDITANAGDGVGGQVTIATQGLFGIRARDRLTPASDITATSSRGTEFRGVVTVIEPDLNTAVGLRSLPSDFITVDDIRRNTCGWTAGSTFYVTGNDSIELPPDIVTPLRYGPHPPSRYQSEQAANTASLETTTLAVPAIVPPPHSVVREADRWEPDAHGNPILQAGASPSGLPACGLHSRRDRVPEPL